MAMNFWEQKTLSEMTQEQWESLCDGCGKCCLQKLEDEDTGEVFYTDVSCHLLDVKTCRCKDYQNRLARVPECIDLTPETASEYSWLPSTCAYRLLAEGKALEPWHPLISGVSGAELTTEVSVRGRVVSEVFVHPDDLEQRIIQWV